MQRSCPYCGFSVRREAIYCPSCGKGLTPVPEGAARPDAAARSTARLPKSDEREARRSGVEAPAAARTARKRRRGCFPFGRKPRRSEAAPGQAGPAAGDQSATRALRTDEMPSLWRARYAELRRDVRPSYGFVTVYDLQCANPACGKRNGTGQGAECAFCRQPLPLYLLHLSRLPMTEGLDPNLVVQLSKEHPLILDHLAFWQENGWYVTLLEYPAGQNWQPLYKMAPISDPKQVARWGIQIGEVLAYLHARNLVHYALDAESREGIILCGGQAMLSDVRKAKALARMSEAQKQPSLRRDIQFVARLVSYMSTGQSSPLAGKSPFAAVFDRAQRDEYDTMGSLLDELKEIELGRQAGAAVTFNTGQATHAGKVRPDNQDSAFVLPMMRLQESRTIATALCVVADGMGGQESGERAAKIAYKTIAAEINERLILPSLRGEVTQKLDANPGDFLQAAVKKANQLVYEAAQQMGIKMGTTVTAALMDGSKAYVANVGDSRTYLLRDGSLRRITEDHSLVASLVKAGIITDDEVYQHPQRNQIFRSLGDKASVDVDLYPLDLQKGDQLLLCSDGLWEMVRDPQILAILSRAASAQQACQELVRAAYNAGGEDNITVVVVKVE